MNDWTNENQIVLDSGAGAIITIPAGEKTPFLIGRHYHTDLEIRGTSQEILGFSIKTNLRVITGEPSALKEEDIRISPNYDKYSHNRAGQGKKKINTDEEGNEEWSDTDLTYDYDVNEFVYGGEDDTWGVLDYQDFHANPFMGIIVRYSNDSDEDIVIELMSIDLQVVSKALKIYEGEDVEPIDGEPISVFVGVSGYSNAIEMTKTTSLVDLKKATQESGGGGIKWEKLENFPADGKPFYTYFTKAPQNSNWVIGRRNTTETVPSMAKISSVEAKIMNHKNDAVLDYIIDLGIWLVKSGSTDAISGTTNLGKSGITSIPTGTVIGGNNWQKAGEWSKTTNDDRSYIYNNTKGIITPSMFNSSQFGFKFRVGRVMKPQSIAVSGQKRLLKIGHTRIKCTYKITNKDSNVPTDHGIGVAVGVTDNSEVIDEGRVKCDSAGNGIANKRPNIWQLLYSAFVQLDNKKIAINGNHAANAKRICPFIGRVTLGCGSGIACTLVDSAKRTLEDKEVYNVYHGYETHGKAGQSKETKPLNTVVRETRIKSLQAYVKWNSIIPINVTPHISVNSPYSARGYVNLFKSDAEYINPLQSKINFDVRYLTKELFPTLQMDYIDTTVLDTNSKMNINTLDTINILNGFDYDSINLELLTDSNNTTPFDITGDFGNFYLKSDKMEEEFSSFSSIEQFKPNYQFRFVANVDEQYDEDDNLTYQNGSLNFSMHGITISIGVPDDPENNTVSIITPTNIHECELIGSVGNDIIISGEISQSGKHKIVVSSNEEKFVFTPSSTNKNTEALVLNVSNYIQEEFIPFAVTVKELVVKEYILSGINLALKEHNVITLPGQVKSYDAPDFYRDSEDGPLPCYVNPTKELFYKLQSWNFFRGSCVVKNKEGEIVEYDDYIVQNRDEITVSNGVTKIIIKPMTNSIEYYAYQNGWILLTTFRLDNLFDVAFNYIGPESVEVRIGTTQWRLDRGNSYFNVRHSKDDIKFDTFNKITYVNENGWLDTVDADSLDEIDIDKWFFVLMENKSNVGIMFLKNPPNSIYSNSLPASELTGIGWYRNHIPLNDKELPILGEDKKYRLIMDDNKYSYEHYTYKAMEWLNDTIQQVMFKLNFKE